MKHILYIFLVGIITSCNQRDKTSHEVLCAKIPSRASVTAVQPTGKPESDAGDSEMAWIEGGRFIMGSNEFEDAKPVHAVTVNGFLDGCS